MNNSVKYQDLISPLKKLAKTSRAKLAKVGCFIVKNNAIISSGVNHNPTGDPMEDEIEGKLVSRPEVVHAEVSALESAKLNGIDLADSTLLLTVAPCLNCAHAITETGIQEVLYLYDWWDVAPLEVLRNKNIKVEKIKEKDGS